MREILFRGKDENGYWQYGFFVREKKSRRAGGQTITEVNFDHNYIVSQNYGILKEVNPETVGQYIGIRDKNLRLIFEGDIIKWVDWNGEERISLVCYDKEWNRFCVWLNGAESMGLNEHFTNNIYVIGNIYDNPELLEVKK